MHSRLTACVLEVSMDSGICDELHDLDEVAVVDSDDLDGK